MSDFVANFDVMGGLSLDRRWKEMDRMEEEQKKERRHAKMNERDIEELENSRSKAGIVKQIWLLNLNQSLKWSLTSLSVCFMLL